MSTTNLPSPTSAASDTRPSTGRLRQGMLTAALAATVTLGAVAPAAAAADGPAFGGPDAPPPDPSSVFSHDVDVVVTSSGDLHIVGDEGRNRIDVHGNGAGYSVWVHKANGQVIPHNLGDGDDGIWFNGANTWDGRLVAATGAGDDQINAGVDTSTSGPPGVTPLGSVDIRMGADDDLLWIDDGLVDNGAGSILRGGSGVDKLESPGSSTSAQATLSGWERFS